MFLSSLKRRRSSCKQCAPESGVGAGGAPDDPTGPPARTPCATPGRRFLFAAAVGGVVAAVVSTLVQIVLWLMFTDAFPGILWRDARLTAAIVLGERVLPPPADFDWVAMTVASAVHFALSLAYAAVFLGLTQGLRPRSALLVGAVLGLLLYLLNLYGFTRVFPWFAVARDGITLAAHVAFGISAVAASRRVLRRPPPC